MTDLQFFPVADTLPETPGNYLGVVEWDSNIAHERWFDGVQFYNCNVDPVDVDFDDSVVWPAPITHWAHTPVFRREEVRNART